LVVRRLRGARTLVLAAAGVTLVTAALLAGLIDYGRAVVSVGAANSVASAPAAERSLLVRGSAGAGAEDLTDRDAAVRAATRDAFASAAPGAQPRVAAAGYATGRQLTGDTGEASGGEDGLVFASIVFAEDLQSHADLVAGAWPRPGQTPVETALAAPLAALIGVGVGDRVPVTDRRTDQTSELVIVGVWQPRVLNDPYWRLFPEVEQGVVPGSATYGPFVLHRDDFVAGYLGTASAAWLVSLDLVDVDLATLRSVAEATVALGQAMPIAAGLGSSGLATTGIGDLADRLERADLVGRSALLTPLLLIVVLGGYALLLIALLLNEHRRAETALMRARGASRAQIAGLATREAVLVVAPAVALAPFFAAELLRLARQTPALVELELPPSESATLVWIVATAASLACGLAMVVPALRRAGTYVEELASRSRPSRWAFAQRAALDLALVAFAAIAWFQLRQHASPLSGGEDRLGIDPLLATAPTVALLAGALLALRVLPWATRLAERRVSRTRWTATMFGLWQAGRRPHAGPVLLLSLAVAVSTLALSLARTAERSLQDQADFQVGADLRLVETDNAAPETRAGDLAALPGVRIALPAVRDVVPVGPEGTPVSVLALDAESAPDVVQLREDLAGGSPDRVFATLADGRVDAPVVGVGPDVTKITGRIETTTRFDPLFFAPPVRTSAVLLDRYGNQRLIPLAVSTDGSPSAFTIELSDELRPGRIVAFVAELLGASVNLTWSLTELAAVSDATTQPVALEGLTWRMTKAGVEPLSMAANGSTLTGWAGPEMMGGFRASAGRVTIAPALTGPSQLLAFVTPGVLTALKAEVGETVRFGLRGSRIQLRIAGIVDALPAATEPDGILVDLPSLGATLLSDYGLIQRPQEWWVGVEPDGYDVAVREAAALNGIRVLDRRAVAEEAGQEPYGLGARVALWGAAGGALLLALVGIAIDVRATARRRVGEFAVLRTLGAGSGLLSRALLAEQSVLAGLGVLSGLLVGIGVAATMAPLVILTPSADRPEPAPLISVPWLFVGATAVGLFALSLFLAALVAASMRQRLVATQLRIGEDR
jgi:hypothetical protein